LSAPPCVARWFRWGIKLVPVVAKNAENRELNPKDSSVALSAKKMQKCLWNRDATVDLYQYTICTTTLVWVHVHCPAILCPAIHE
jgi:hypothetical protein